MSVPKPLVVASLILLSLITGTVVTSMPPSLYAQSNSGSNTGTTHFVATLNGESLFPPVKKDARGKAELALVGNGKTMAYKIQVDL